MEKITCENLEICYQKSGTGKQALLLLHGWGVDHTLMTPLLEHLSRYFTVYNPDWPGFGESSELQYAFGTADYCRILKAFIQKLGLEDPLIIAHSFGCRIALRYGAGNPVRKMILTAAAGVPPQRGAKYYLKTYGYKALKQLHRLPFLKQIEIEGKFGSADYRLLSGVMKTTFIKIVNEDIRPLLPEVSAETLLVYGENDEDTPLWMGEYLAKHLPNAGLAVFAGDDHYAYLHQLPRFLQVTDIFFKEEEENADHRL